MSPIRSASNPRVRRWRRLAEDARERRAEGRVLIEGPRLLDACLAAGGNPRAIVLSEAGARDSLIARLVERSRREPTILSDSAFRALSGTEAPQGVAAEIDLPARAPDLAASRGCLFLDGVQDAGNVGTILRSAAALGLRDAVLGQGCADAWSAKVLRAAAGAHFSLAISSGVDLLAALDRFGGTLACAVVRGGVAPATADLSGRIGWIFGAEGGGVREAIAARADLKLTIPMPGSAESLNVAAAAAILLYERARQLSTRAARS